MSSSSGRPVRRFASSCKVFKLPVTLFLISIYHLPYLPYVGSKNGIAMGGMGGIVPGQRIWINIQHHQQRTMRNGIVLIKSYHLRWEVAKLDSIHKLLLTLTELAGLLSRNHHSQKSWDKQIFS